MWWNITNSAKGIKLNGRTGHTVGLKREIEELKER